MFLLLLAKIIAAFTGAEFLGATIFYFRRRAHLQRTMLLTVFILAAEAVHALFLIMAADTSEPRLVVALGLFAVSNGLFWSALAAHGAMRPSAVFGQTVPATIVTSGPYAIIRHPFYLAYVTAFFGSAFIGNHWLLFVTAFALFLCYNHAAAHEEHLLSHATEPLGTEYAEYLRHTWRWLPLVW